MVNKRIFLPVFFVVVAIGFLFMISTVSAATGINFYTPNANETNISGSAYVLYANITEAALDSSIGNVTFWYQPRSYALNETWTLIERVQNTTNQSRFNTTWDTTAVADGNYWINATSITYPTNATVNATNATLSLTIDNTAPTLVVYGTAPTAYANTTIHNSTAVATANLTLSIYITDATIGMANNSIAVCFVNVGGGVNHTIPMFSTGRTTGWCNASDTNVSTAINISGLSDGNQTINVYVNDTITNLLNGTLVAHIDTTSPVATATCSPSTAQTGDTYPCSCSGTDATSGVNTSTGTSTSGTVTSTSSTGTFTYTCTVTDYAGFSTTATAAYSIVQTPGSGGGNVGTTWITHTVTDTVFEQGYTTALPANSRIKVQVDSQDHYVSVVSVSTTEAVIEVSSNPVKITLSAGEDATVDVNSDGFYDVYVLLNGIVNNKADIKIQKIHDAVPQGEGPIATTGTVEAPEAVGETESSGGSSLTWLWILIAVIIIVAAFFWLKTGKKK